MGNIKHYIILLLLTMGSNIYAQSAHAQKMNDSVFSAISLSSIPLTDVSKQKSVFLPFTNAGRLTLFVFLSPECPLCQNYTTVLNKLEKEYQGKVKCYGIFPGQAYDAAAIQAFREKYKIDYSLLIDGSFRLTRYLQATVTPETILLNDKNELVYKGAIDNWLKDLGKMQPKTTAHYLQDALSRYPDRYNPKRTRPVGCLINDR